ncbi:sugar ABC transporter ATP-binding protein [Streptomyces sp. NPDC059909]|uniref:sugar ABC transporter ATP-binding protein n=1 Tax=Streptomyces sp. NPDC059909 TaxID=3346998 RepID=UPI0036671FBF
MAIASTARTDRGTSVAGTETDVPAIEALGVEKVYGATLALGGADLVVHPGELHALLGENGAGKSTLVRILAGVERADSGSIRLFGEPVHAAHGTGSRASHAFIHQDLALFQTMSVAANIAMVGGFDRRAGLISDRRTNRRAAQLLDRLGMRIDPRMMVGELPLADQTAVAVARALSHGVRLIVLDEPTAYLEARQVHSLLQLLGRLRAEGVACLLITHRAGDVLDHCDSLTVLRDGRTVASEPAAGLSERDLVRLISGEAAASAARPARTRGSHEPLLRLSHAASPAFGPLSLDLGAGEIAGICGLADSGAFEVGRAVFGLAPLTSGTMWFDGRTATPSSPAQAVAKRIAYVPSERRTAGIAESLTVRENLFMRPSVRWFAPLRIRQERRRSAKLIETMGVYPALPEQPISAFSGGNQQKAVLAKWLRDEPRLLVLNDPTAGVDLAAKADIHARLRAMATKLGIGVLLISSDFSEVAELSDRVYVMRRGSVVAEVDAQRTTAGELVTLAYGGAQKGAQT